MVALGGEHRDKMPTMAKQLLPTQCVICGFAYGIPDAIRAVSVPSTWVDDHYSRGGGDRFVGFWIFEILRMPQEFLNSNCALALTGTHKDLSFQAPILWGANYICG